MQRRDLFRSINSAFSVSRIEDHIPQTVPLSLVKAFAGTCEKETRKEAIAKNIKPHIRRCRQHSK